MMKDDGHPLMAGTVPPELEDPRPTVEGVESDLISSEPLEWVSYLLNLPALIQIKRTTGSAAIVASQEGNETKRETDTGRWLEPILGSPILVSGQTSVRNDCSAGETQ
jgi:hypothetical protein